MKQLFGRHRDRLSREESRALWNRIQEATSESPPSTGLLRPAWVAVAAVLIVAGSIWLHQRRDVGEQMMHSRQEEMHHGVSGQLAQQYPLKEAAGLDSVTRIVSPGVSAADPVKPADGLADGDAIESGREIAAVQDSRPHARPGGAELPLPPSIARALAPSADAEQSEPAPTEVRVDQEVARQPETGGPGAGSEPPSGTATDPALAAALPPEAEHQHRKMTRLEAGAESRYAEVASRLGRSSSTPQERVAVTGTHPDAVSQYVAKAATGSIAGTVRGTDGTPIAHASIIVLNEQYGSFTRNDGSYRISGVPAGTYSLLAENIGCQGQRVDGVVVSANQTVQVDFVLPERPKAAHDMVEIKADRPVRTGMPLSGEHPSDAPIMSLPTHEMSEVMSLKAGVIAREGQLHFRGGHPGVEKRHIPPPFLPTTGGTTLPNDQVYDSMFFEHYGVNPFVPADEDALSTFAVDVDHGSYTITRRYIEGGHLPPKEAVRVEEFVNYFDQGYPDFTDTDFRIFLDGAPSPFGGSYQLIRIGIKGRVIEDHERKPANLTFVIDVSGSMAREDRLGLVRSSLRLLVERLRQDDSVGIVVFGTRGRVLLEPAPIGSGADLALADAGERDEWIHDRREQLLDAIDRLQPEGSTNTEEGLLLGFEMARRMYRPGAINRIILCSDGVGNVGRTGPESILEKVRTEADKGIQLTAIGFGMGNYNDVLMEQLANRGDGAYHYVDRLCEARRVLVENLTGTLQTIARDAKVQVEFDPERVVLWRLLGFENRHVAGRDFRNDRVDAGEIGAGHSVTALYEVKLAPEAGRGRIATVRFRYAPPGDESGLSPDVREIESLLDSGTLHGSFAEASPHFRLTAAVAEFAEILRRSYWARESRIADVLPVARSAAARLRDDPAVQEFVSLAERSAGLDDRITPQERERMHGPQKPLPPGSVVDDPAGGR